MYMCEGTQQNIQYLPIHQIYTVNWEILVVKIFLFFPNNKNLMHENYFMTVNEL